MKLNIRLIATMLLSTAAVSLSAQSPTILKGTVPHYPGEGYFTLRGQTAREVVVDTIQPKADGSFSHEFRGVANAAPRAIVLDYMGGGYLQCYIMPGTTLQMDVTTTEEEVEFRGVKQTNIILHPTFKGKAKAESDYLNRPFFHEYKMSDEQGRPVSYQNYLGQIRALQAENRKALAKTSEEFREEHLPEVDALLEGRRFSYAWQLKSAGHGMAAASDPDFMAYVRSLDANADGAESVADELTRFREQVYTDRYADQPAAARYFCFLRDSISNVGTKQTLADRRMATLLGRGRSDMDRVFAVYREVAQGSKQYASLEKKYQDQSKFMPGATLADFPMKTPSGEATSLHAATGKGKLTYIDLWATWCGPCVMEIPFIEKLVEKYKDNANIEFVSISLDTDQQKWLKKLEDDKPQWAQYIVERDFLQTWGKDYGITGIPRFIMLDKAGRLITIDAPRPSDESCEKLIEQQLKKVER